MACSMNASYSGLVASFALAATSCPSTLVGMIPPAVAQTQSSSHRRMLVPNLPGFPLVVRRCLPRGAGSLAGYADDITMHVASFTNGARAWEYAYSGRLPWRPETLWGKAYGGSKSRRRHERGYTAVTLRVGSSRSRSDASRL